MPVFSHFKIKGRKIRTQNIIFDYLEQFIGPIPSYWTIYVQVSEVDLLTSFLWKTLKLPSDLSICRSNDYRQLISRGITIATDVDLKAVHPRNITPRKVLMMVIMMMWTFVNHVDECEEVTWLICLPFTPTATVICGATDSSGMLEYACSHSSTHV